VSDTAVAFFGFRLRCNPNNCDYFPRAEFTG
jgi:hypothetical protein